MSLQEQRLKSGMSQNDLSVKSKIPKTTIQKYERNALNINLARLQILCDLCLALNCGLTDILTDDELIKKLKSISEN